MDGPARIGLVSHVLPPAPSGQSMMIFNLLGGLAPDAYCLILSEEADATAARAEASRLPGPCHALHARYRFPPRVLAFTAALRRRGLRVASKAVNLVFHLRNLLNIPLLARQIEGIAAQERCDVLVGCTGGSSFDFVTTWLACRRLRIPFVACVFDYYAYQLTGLHRWICRLTEPLLLRAAAATVVLNEFLQREYVDRYGVNAAIVRNPCALRDLAELDATASPFPAGELAITYTGAVYEAHYDAFQSLVAALGLLRAEGVPATLHVYTFVAPEILRQKGIGGEHVVFHAPVSPAEIPAIQRHSSILFLPLAFDSPYPAVIRTSAPAKMGEYLAVGRPILVHAPPQSFVEWYFGQHDCGLLAAEKDPALVARLIRRIAREPGLGEALGSRARQRAEMDFDPERVRQIFSAVLAEARLSGTRSR